MAVLFPVRAAAAHAFDDARWIWFSAEPMPDSIEFPAGSAFFRGCFDVADPAQVEAARLAITADNLWVLHVNGRPVGACDMDPNHWNQPRSIDIRGLLRPGRNAVAVEAVNTVHGPAGLIVSLELGITGGHVVRHLSGESWKCSDRLQGGWQDPEFDDRRWPAAHVVGEFGMPPWGRVPVTSNLSQPGAPAEARLKQFHAAKVRTRRGNRSGPAPPPEIIPPADYPWPDAIAFLADDCSLYRPAKGTGTAQDSLRVTIFNPNHTRAYPEHDLPAPVKMGRRLMSLRPARPGVEPTTLWDAGGGAIGSPAASYDGRWIYFAMAAEGDAFFHLYRIAADGGNPEQLTDGPFHDIDPCELPDGRLVFSSTRIGVFEEYHNPPARALFVRELNGSIHPLTHTIVFDNEPRMLADGRILFLRSDNFFDRGKVETRLHAIYPDGTTGQTEFGLENGPEYGGRLRAFNAGSAAPLADGRVAWVDGKQVLVARPGEPRQMWRRIPVNAADLAALPDARLVGTVVGTESGSAWPFNRIAIIDPDGDESGAVTVHESSGGPVHSPIFVGPTPKPHRLVKRVDPAATDRPGQTGVFYCQDVRLTHNSTAGWEHVRAVRVLAGKGLNYRSSHSYLVHAGNETVDLGTVPLAPDGSFAVEVPANTAIAFQAVDAEGRSELNQMSWIYVKPGESRGCVGCHQPRANAPPLVGSTTLQAMRTRPLKLTGRGDPLRFRGNNAAVTGLMELQFDRFREIAGLNRHRSADRSGKEEVAALIDDLESGDPDRQHGAAQRAGVFRDPACAPALAACLDSDDRELRVAAAMALATCGLRESVEPLTRALADRDPLVAQAAVVALENLTGIPLDDFDPFAPRRDRGKQLPAFARRFAGVGDAAWQQQLARTLDASDRDRARRAAVSLSHCGDQASVGALVDYLLSERSHNPLPEWKRKHQGDGTRFNSRSEVNPRSLQEVTRAVGSLGGDGEVPALAETAARNLDPKTGNLFLAEACVEALGEIGTTAAEQVLLDLIPQLPPYHEHCYWYGDHPALIACHAAPVHARIVEALDVLGSTAAGPHVPALIRMVPTDPDRALFPGSDDFETLVGRVIRRSGREAAVVETCLHVLGDPDAPLNPDVLAALNEVHGAWAGTPGPDIRAAQILSLVTRDPALEARVRAAFERCRSLPNDIPRVYDIGIPVVSELPSRHWTSFYLARTLGQIGDPSSVASLRSALDDCPAEAASGRPDPLGPGVHFLHNDLTPCWRAAAAWALGRIGDPGATPSLLGVLGDAENAPDTRHAAAVALARTATAADLPAMRELADEVPEVSVRHALLIACEAVGSRLPPERDPD
ncbi:HEAT repeat domain-containing protein [Haloferula sp. A504]|uniref:HEAT repeat domain-containing protein n=1 Tax=Haloferula sp. A504 TaxID=3373601 RepID=UPI0031C63805|nr:HEAT repeat domain-containing protein [Verrucomicrobiaceae bacterium E54]